MHEILIGVLTRFRQERIAFMADIEQMFYQVRVKECYNLKNERMLS